MRLRLVAGLALGTMLWSTYAWAQSPVLAYVTNYGSNTVSVIDASSHTQLTTVTVGQFPAGLDATPDGRLVYVANSGDNTVSVIATATNVVIATIHVGASPSAIAILPDGSKAYVTNGIDNSVSVIDLSTNTVMKTLSDPDSMRLHYILGPPYFGNAPAKLGVTPDGRHVYIANTDPFQYPVSVSLTVIDTATDTLSRTAPLSSIDHFGWTLTGEVVVSADGLTGFTAAWYGYIEAFDTTTNLETAAFSLTGGNPGVSLGGIATGPNTSFLYVTSEDHDSVYVVDPSNPASAFEVPLPGSPHSVAISPDGSTAFVTLGNESTVAVIDTTTNLMTGTIAVGSAPFDVLFVKGKEETPPSILCESGPGGWSSTNVSIACAAQDSSSGLANPADASFTLSTNVPAGVETAAAQTNTRQVCDVVGNCVAVGPLAFKVDRRPPSITIVGPVTTAYLLNQVVNANFACSDGGSGISTCDGSAPSGSPVATATSGPHTFQVSASDLAGNPASSSVNYTVGFGVSAMFDQTHGVKSGSTIPIRLRLTDAAGVNLSSPSVVVTATSIALVGSTNTVGVDDSGNADPESNFRYDSALGGYIFNLSTKGLSVGIYRLAFVAIGDPNTHFVNVVVGK